MTHVFRTCWFIIGLILAIPIGAAIVAWRYRAGYYYRYDRRYR